MVVVAKIVSPEGMFQDLMGFSKQRTKRQAFGFYLFYLFLSVLLFGIFGMWYGLIFGTTATTFNEGLSQGFELGQSIGLFVNPLYCLIIGALVLSAKKLVQPKYIFIVLIGVLMAPFGGSLIGLFPISYLTMKKNGGM